MGSPRDVTLGVEEVADAVFQPYRKKGVTWLRFYLPGEDLTGVSVSAEDTPEDGGMIARNPKNHDDQWYVAKQYVADNYEPA